MSSQIDALQRSVPQLNAPAKAAAPAAQGPLPVAAVTTHNPAELAASAPDNALLGIIESLIRLGEEYHALSDRINETRRLSALSITTRAPLLARFYRPEGSGPFPAGLEVHGGAWTSGDRLNNTAIGEHLDRRT